VVWLPVVFQLSVICPTRGPGWAVTEVILPGRAGAASAGAAMKTVENISTAKTSAKKFRRMGTLLE
jgi:hypothetical protein